MSELIHPRSGRQSRRVLAIRGGALGDFILTLPALQALRESCEDLQLLTRPAYGIFAREFDLVSGWRDLEAPDIAMLHVRGAPADPSLRNWLGSFDRVVSWVPDPDGIFQEQIRRCGVPDFCQGDWRCAGSGPAAEQLAQAVPGLRLSMVNPVVLSGSPHLWAGSDAPWIALHPGSGSPRKNWPLDCWLQVMQSLQQREPGIRWRIVTGEAEEERLNDLYALLKKEGLPWEPLHGLPLTDLVRRLQECRLFLGHDSGVAHLAAACGVPCRILFGPTDPAVWAPLGNHVRVLRADQGNWSMLLPEAVIKWLDDPGPLLRGAGPATS